MSKGKYENVADARDYQMVDPTGQFQGQLDNLGRMTSGFNVGLMGALGDPNAAFNQFMGQAPGFAEMAQGPGAQLTQQLNALAAQQAQEGINNAATQFAGQGALHSGAGARAMGQAAATPFAQVAADLGGRQADLTGQLWGQGLQGAQAWQQLQPQILSSLLGQGMGLQTGMASELGGMMAPQYQYQPGFWDRAMQVGQLGVGALSAFNPFSRPSVPGQG